MTPFINHAPRLLEHSNRCAPNINILAMSQLSPAAAINGQLVNKAPESSVTALLQASGEIIASLAELGDPAQIVGVASSRRRGVAKSIRFDFFSESQEKGHVSETEVQSCEYRHEARRD